MNYIVKNLDEADGERTAKAGLHGRASSSPAGLTGAPDGSRRVVDVK